MGGLVLTVPPCQMLRSCALCNQQDAQGLPRTGAPLLNDYWRSRVPPVPMVGGGVAFGVAPDAAGVGSVLVAWTG